MLNRGWWVGERPRKILEGRGNLRFRDISLSSVEIYTVVLVGWFESSRLGNWDGNGNVIR